MSNEAIPQQIIAALTANFEEIAPDGGNTYWYKPDRVLVCGLSEDVFSGLGGTKTFYVLDVPDGAVTEQGASSGCVNGRVNCYLMVARNLNLAVMDPWKISGEKFLVESRLVRDATRALLMDVQLNGIAYNTIASSLSVEYGLSVQEPWCAAAMTFEVSYSTPKETP